MSEALQLPPQFDVIINFPVISDPIAPLRTDHRLMAGFSQIDSRQPPVSQCLCLARRQQRQIAPLPAALAALVEKRKAKIIRTAMMQQVRHRCDPFRINGPTPPIPDSSYSAHPCAQFPLFQFL